MVYILWWLGSNRFNWKDFSSYLSFQHKHQRLLFLPVLHKILFQIVEETKQSAKTKWRLLIRTSYVSDTALESVDHTTEAHHGRRTSSRLSRACARLSKHLTAPPLLRVRALPGSRLLGRCRGGSRTLGGLWPPLCAVAPSSAALLLAPARRPSFSVNGPSVPVTSVAVVPLSTERCVTY